MDPRDYPEKVRKSKASPSVHHSRKGPAANIKQAYLDDRAAYVREQVLQGKTMKTIAEELGVSIGKVHKDFHDSCAAVRCENVEEARALYNSRYEAVIAGHLDKAIAGDARSAEVVIKATAAAARLHGAEAPIKLAGADGGPIEVTEVTADELLARIGRLAGEATERRASEDPPKPVTH